MSKLALVQGLFAIYTRDKGNCFYSDGLASFALASERSFAALRMTNIQETNAALRMTNLRVTNIQDDESRLHFQR